MPDWLFPVRGRAAELAGHEPEELVEVLVQRYPPGSKIGWHRDAPAFGPVVGVSLGGSSRLRFQRGKGDARRVWEVELEPPELLATLVPPTKELRYSITFRTLRR